MREWHTGLIAPPLDLIILIGLTHTNTHYHHWSNQRNLWCFSRGQTGAWPALPRPQSIHHHPGLTWSSESNGKEIKTASLKTYTMSGTDENVKTTIKPYRLLVVLATQTAPKPSELNTSLFVLRTWKNHPANMTQTQSNIRISKQNKHFLQKKYKSCSTKTAHKSACIKHLSRKNVCNQGPLILTQQGRL